MEKILLTDITYLPYNDTFAYLSTIIDAFTKQVLSYILSYNLKLNFVLLTVEQLIENNKISLNSKTILIQIKACTIPAIHHNRSVSFRYLQ